MCDKASSLVGYVWGIPFVRLVISLKPTLGWDLPFLRRRFFLGFYDNLAVSKGVPFRQAFLGSCGARLFGVVPSKSSGFAALGSVLLLRFRARLGGLLQEFG